MKLVTAKYNSSWQNKIGHGKIQFITAKYNSKQQIQNVIFRAKVFEVTVSNEIYVGSNYPVQTNSCQQKSYKNFLLFYIAELQWNWLQSVTKTTVWLPFLLLSKSSKSYSQEWRLKSKFVIFSPQNLKNPKSANLISHEKFPATR